MDFYNPLYWSINENAYSLFKSIYPPLTFIILDAIVGFLPIKGYASALDLRAGNPTITIILLITYFIILLTAFHSHSWRNLIPSALNRLALFVVFLFSTPILFSFERGNIIFLTIPFFIFLIHTKSEIIKYISLAILVNIKPYFILFLISKLHDFKRNIYFFLYYIVFIGAVFILTSYIYELNIYEYLSTFIDFGKKTPIPYFETLSMPLSINALTAYKDYSPKTHNFATLFYLPTLLNFITIFYLIYLLTAKSFEANKYLLGASLIILNFSTNIGGYGYLFYIPIIPLLLKENQCKKYLYLLFFIFIIPLDIIKIGSLHNNIFDTVNSYLGQTLLKNITHPFTLGSLLRPIANYLILLIFTFSLHQDVGKNNFLISISRKFIEFFNKVIRNLPYVQPKTHQLFSIFFIISICFFYNILFTFGSSPITEGWFLAIAHLINSGKTPYLDFNLYLPPLYPLIISWYSQVFGESFYSLRILGLLITTGMWCILFLLLRKKFTYGASILATATSMIFYESGVAFISYDFTQFLILFFLCTTYMLYLAYEHQQNFPKDEQTKNFMYLFLAGLFSSLAFFIKQSNGAFVVLASLVCVTIMVFQNKKNKFVSFISFAIGGIFPALVILVWLIQNGALLIFLDQIFFGAISAKGSIENILFAWFSRIFSPSFNKSLFLFLGVFSLISLGVYLLRRKLLDKLEISKPNNLTFYKSAVFYILILAAIYLTYYYSNLNISIYLIKYGWKLERFIAPISFCTCLFILTTPFLIKLFPNLADPKKYGALTLVSIMSIGLIWGNGTSGGVGEMALFLPFSIFICLVLEIKSLKFLLTIITLMICISLISYYSDNKFKRPYYWWGIQEENVRLANKLSSIPLLANLKISDSAKNTTDELFTATTKIDSGDIFAFPNIPIVYLLSNRWPNSRVLIQWFDFLPDHAAAEEAHRILLSPPHTIVNLNLPDFVWEKHEEIFRNGAKSGQREIQKAISSLTKQSNLYELTFSKTLSDGYVLDVWNLKSSM